LFPLLFEEDLDSLSSEVYGYLKKSVHK